VLQSSPLSLPAGQYNGLMDVVLYLNPRDALKTDIAYVLPVGLAQSLQKDVAAGKLQLEAMYEKIEKSLVRRQLPKP
jgi:hypothetical protein